MALSDYTPECRQVMHHGKPLFTVEGLSLETLAVLVKTHLPDLESVFDIVLKGEHEEETYQDQLSRIATGLALSAPGLVSNIIAVSSGEELTEDLVRVAGRLPFPVQVQAMIDIGSLTFDEAGGIKKSIESLMILLVRLRTKPLSGQKAEQMTRKAASSESTGGSDET